MSRFNKKSSSDIAVQRLKLVLTHDRNSTGPNAAIVTRIKRDIINVISQYVDIDEENFEVEVTRSAGQDQSYKSKLVANIPIKNIKTNG